MANSTEAAQIILEVALRSGDGIPDVLVVDHDPKFTSTLFREFTWCIGSSLIVGSAYHKNSNAKTERVNGVLGDTLRAFANGRKDDWDAWLPYAVFAINNAASTLGDKLIPFFIEGAQTSHAPRALPDLRVAGETHKAYAARMKYLEHEVCALLHAAQRGWGHRLSLPVYHAAHCRCRAALQDCDKVWREELPRGLRRIRLDRDRSRHQM
jgi:transposase InsO family protein